jgi:hypothetical protein
MVYQAAFSCYLFERFTGCFDSISGHLVIDCYPLFYIYFEIPKAFFE